MFRNPGWRAPCWAGFLLAALSGVASAQDARAGSRRALLVGVERYPPASRWPTLEGPAADVDALREALVGRFGFERGDVQVLRDEAATHAGIAAALERLAEGAAPGDVLLFYFAGHGSRLPDDSGDETDGWDETIVPYDACAGERRDGDVRDDEIGAWIVRANLKTDQVVLIFDCCSSGTNVRDETPGRSRFLSPEQRFDGLEGRARGFEPARRVDPDSAAGSAASPAERKGSDWVLPRARYVALSACRAEESAFEVRAGETGTRGIFTLSLVEELLSIDPGASWSDLMLRVSARVLARASKQTPVLEGCLAGYGLFRDEAPARAPSFRAEIGPAGELRVAAGHLQGLAPGSVISVRGRAEGSASLEAEIVESAAASSIGRWRAGRDAPLAPGPCLAFLLQPAADPGHLPVSIEGLPGRADALARALLAARAARRTDAAGARLRLVALEGGAGGGWRILDGSGRPLAEADDETAVLEGVARLARAWRTEHVLRSTPARETEVEISLVRLGGSEADGALRVGGELDRDAQGRRTLRPGTPWLVRVSNRSPVPLYASLVLVFPDGEIAIACPPGPDDRIEPGGPPWTCQPGELEIPPGNEGFYAQDAVRLYCLLTPRAPDLSSVAQPPFRSSAEATRGASRDGTGSDGSELAGEIWAAVATEISLR